MVNVPGITFVTTALVRFPGIQVYELAPEPPSVVTVAAPNPLQVAVAEMQESVGDVITIAFVTVSVPPPQE